MKIDEWLFSRNFFRWLLLILLIIFLLIPFSLYTSWIKIHELSPWQCLVLCLISSQERANKHKLSLTINTKSTLKIKKLETSFISKVNWITFLLWSCVIGNYYARHQICRSVSNYILIFGRFFHIYKVIHID